jgi:hypothetical protein
MPVAGVVGHLLKEPLLELAALVEVPMVRLHQLLVRQLQAI